LKKPLSIDVSSNLKYLDMSLSRCAIFDWSTRVYLIDKSLLDRQELLDQHEFTCSTRLNLIDTTLLDRYDFTWSSQLYLINTTYWSTRLIDRHDLIWSTWLNLIDTTLLDRRDLTWSTLNRWIDKSAFRGTFYKACHEFYYRFSKLNANFGANIFLFKWAYFYVLTGRQQSNVRFTFFSFLFFSGRMYFSGNRLGGQALNI
jgi:hypothetical protein